MQEHHTPPTAPVLSSPLSLEVWVSCWKQGTTSIQWPVVGHSMEPFLQAGDCVEIIPCSVSQLKIGDVIAFIQQGKLVVHRLLYSRVQHGQWQGREQGDDCTQGTWIQASALVGKVKNILRGNQTIQLQNGLFPIYNRMLGYYMLCKLIAKKWGGFFLCGHGKKRRF